MNKNLNDNGYAHEVLELFNRVNTLEKKIAKTHPVIKMLAGIPNKSQRPQQPLQPAAFLHNFAKGKSEKIQYNSSTAPWK